MRLWSIHPEYLDTFGLVALWREGLLAQKVLIGQTKGYKNHPQLIRFKRQENPILYIGFYLYEIWKESQKRGYNFNQDKILIKPDKNFLINFKEIKVSTEQLKFELKHLKNKINKRSPKDLERLKETEKISPHPLFIEYIGKIEDWERL